MQRTPTIPAGEAAAARLCFWPVAIFLVFVLTQGGVSPLEYLTLASKIIGLTLFVIAGAVGLFALVELARAGRRSGWRESPGPALADSVRRRWSEDRAFCLFWPVGIFMLLLPAFNAFKQRILPQAGFRHDPALAEMDRALFGGDPGAMLHALIGSPALTGFLDALYHGWFVPTTLGICVVGLCAGTRDRAQYMLAYACVWILLGAAAAFAFPAAGPAFYAALVDPAGATPFAAVHAELLEGSDGRLLSSLANQAYLLENLGAGELALGAGISAVPSIHNALAVLFALASFRIHAALGAAMTAFALLIWIGSVYLNWHYAVDGLFGAAGALAIWIGAGKVVERTLRRAESRSVPASAGAPAPA